MATTFFIIFSILDFILQCAAAVFSYQIYSFHRLSKAWLAVPIGFGLLALRRALSFLQGTGYLQNSVLSPILESVFIPFIISLLLVIGIWAMYNSFQKFSLTEQEVSEKIATFKKQRKAKKRR